MNDKSRNCPYRLGVLCQKWSLPCAECQKRIGCGGELNPPSKFGQRASYGGRGRFSTGAELAKRLDPERKLIL